MLDYVLYYVLLTYSHPVVCDTSSAVSVALMISCSKTLTLQQIAKAIAFLAMPRRLPNPHSKARLVSATIPSTVEEKKQGTRCFNTR